MSQQSSAYKGISLFIKLTIVSICLYYIYYKIFARNDFLTISSEFRFAFHKINIFNILLLFVLMFCNWSLEALKWKMIINHLESISFLKSVQAIFTGITVSIFTPNRVGEFGGRIFFLQPDNRIKGIALTFLGSISQLLITILSGALALVLYLPGYTNINAQQTPYLYFSIVVFILIVIIVVLILYFNISLINVLTRRIQWFKRIQHYLNSYDEYSFVELIKIILLSLLRYTIFVIQFYMILQLFNVNVPFVQGFVMIALTFFAITAIPTITITELGIRGSASLAFIGLLSNNSVGIVAASFALWLINIAIPAIIGSVFVFKLNFFKSKT